MEAGISGKCVGLLIAILQIVPRATAPNSGYESNTMRCNDFGTIETKSSAAPASFAITLPMQLPRGCQPVLSLRLRITVPSGPSSTSVVSATLDGRGATKTFIDSVSNGYSISSPSIWTQRAQKHFVPYGASMLVTDTNYVAALPGATIRAGTHEAAIGVTSNGAPVTVEVEQVQLFATASPANAIEFEQVPSKVTLASRETGKLTARLVLRRPGTSVHVLLRLRPRAGSAGLRTVYSMRIPVRRGTGIVEVSLKPTSTGSYLARLESDEYNRPSTPLGIEVGKRERIGIPLALSLALVGLVLLVLAAVGLVRLRRES